MADSGAIRNYLSGLEANLKTVLGSVFDYMLKELRFGRAGDADGSRKCSEAGESNQC